jgi:hypothetical protein
MITDVGPRHFPAAVKRGGAMTKRSVVAAMAVVLVFCLALGVEAGSATASGRQTRGTPGHNAELIGGQFEIPAGVTASITQVECSGAGFWIEGPVHRNFDNAAQAKGLRLGPGKYRALPNLKPNQQEASVAITATW